MRDLGWSGWIVALLIEAVERMRPQNLSGSEWAVAVLVLTGCLWLMVQVVRLVENPPTRRVTE